MRANKGEKKLNVNRFELWTNKKHELHAYGCIRECKLEIITLLIEIRYVVEPQGLFSLPGSYFCFLFDVEDEEGWFKILFDDLLKGEV